LFGSPVFLDYLVFVERSEYKQKKKGRIQNKEDGEDGGRFIILDRSLSSFFSLFFSSFSVILGIEFLFMFVLEFLEFFSYRDSSGDVNQRT
jgi:hypothetical protein